MTAGVPGPVGALVRDLVVGCRTAGLRGFASQVVAETFGRAFERGRVVVIEQELSEVREVVVPAGVQIERFAGDWTVLQPILTRRARVRFERRLSAGRTCLVAHRAGRGIGYTWISTALEPGIEQLPLALPPDAAYLWDLFVVRAERGGGAGSALTAARLALARGAGFRLGWRAIAPTNRASVRTAEKTGALRRVGEIRWRRLFGRTRYREVRFGEQSVLRPPATSGKG